MTTRIGYAIALAFATSLLAGSAVIAPALGQEEPSQRSLAITVYNQNLGLVKEVRELNLPSGTGWVRFRDVPAQIDPTSVHLRPADGGELDVLEQNYEYDLVSSQKILERYLDADIRVIMEEGRTHEGRLLSATDANLVLQTGGDRPGIVVLNREKVTDIEFPELPQGLITRPTLAWLLNSGESGERQVEVSYLTGGMQWHAEYVAIADAEDKHLDISGWVSIENSSGASYPDALLQLVAGEVQRVGPEHPPAYNRGAPVMEMAKAAPFTEEAFFEYHLYTLERRATLQDNETKQISLFEPATATVTKLYETNPQRDGNHVRVVLETTNSTEMGLGMPLPKGVVRVYKRDPRGQLTFLGEDRIDHTPRDEKVRITVGKAFDLVAERTELATRAIGPRDREVDVQIELRNRKEREDVTIVVQEDLYGDWRILKADHEYTRKSATRIEFAVPVKAGTTETVNYTVRYTW